MTRKHFKVESVIFDMDGVITNTMPDHYRSWRHIFQEEGIDVTYEDIYKREGQPGLSSVSEIFREKQKPIDKRRALQILQKKEVFFKKIVKTRFIPGARTFLRRLHKKDIRLALVTGTSRHECCRILPKQVRDLFSVIVAGNEVTHGKPHPEPYLKSLQKLKVRPSHAVVVENAPFGIRSAKRAGLTCLALETSLSRKYLGEADMIFSSIQEMAKKANFSLFTDNNRIKKL